MKRAISLIVVSCAFAVFAQTAAAAATFYAPQYNDDNILAFDVTSGGTVTPVAGSPFGAAAGGLHSFATTPDGRKGFAGYLFTPGVRGFALGADGSVTSGEAKIGLVNGVYEVAVTPDSRFAYAATRDTPAGIRAYSIADGGALTALPGSPYGTLWEFFDVAVTPDQKFVYGTVGMALIAFSVNADGTLTQIGPVGEPVAQWASTSPDGRFLFVGGEDGGDAALFSFAIQPDGSLTRVGDPIVTGGSSGKRPAVAPNGRYVYMPENNTNVVVVARVNPDGSLTQVGALNNVEARSIVVSQDSKRLYMQESTAAGQLAVSVIGADGIPGPPQNITPYDPSSPVRMHFRTGYGGVAEITSKLSTKPLTVTFDGSKSTAKQGAIGDLDWLINGAGATGPVQTHKFPKAGVYDVSLTARDAGGCGSEHAWLGQTAPCMGSPESTKSIKYDTPPWVTTMTIKPKRIGRRTKVRFKLTEKARVTFTVQRPTKGRLVGKSCRKQSRKNRKAKRCTRWVNVKSFRVNGRAGRTNSVKFNGKIGRTKLKKGRYRLRAIAVDSAKGKSPQRIVRFRIR